MVLICPRSQLFALASEITLTKTTQKQEVNMNSYGDTRWKLANRGNWRRALAVQIRS